MNRSSGWIRSSSFLFSFASIVLVTPALLFAQAPLHSKSYKYSYSDQSHGSPGSYRLPFTTSWSVADHLRLAAGREQAPKILRKSGWDGGIITEGVDPATGVMDQAGRAFATAAGYVADAICDAYCKDRPQATH